MNTQDNRSIEELTRAIEFDPTDVDAYHYRGRAYHKKGNYDKAIADYTKSIKLNPKLADAYNSRGAAHSRKGDYDQAIEDLNKAIQLNPKSAKAYNNRGTAYRWKCDYDKAIADYTESIKLNPKSAKAYNNRGAAHSRKGDYDQAIEDLNKAIQLKSAKAYNNHKELHNWITQIERLLHRLRNLAAHPSIDRLALNTCEATYRELMKKHQTRKLPEQTLRQISEYRQEFMDGRKKLIDRKRFFDLSTQAMKPNVETCYPLPKIDKDDLRLVEKWHNLPQNSLDTTSLIKTESRDRELGRLLSARSAEKIAADFYQHYEKEVTDISITQIHKNNKSDWKDYDLNVGGLPIDVKNSRQSWKSRDRYTEHCIPRFKYSREHQDVKIAGVFSPYLWVFELLDKPVEYHQYRTIQFLGEIAPKKLQELKNEFNDWIDFELWNSTGIYFLPPWMFDYPEYVYTERNKARKELKEFANLDSLKGATFEFDPLPVSIAAGVDLREILGNRASEKWEQSFLNRLRNRIEKYGLSLPFLFLTVLTHFLDMAHSSKTVSDFEPDRYRKFLFYEECDRPLGIYDPLETIDALIKALSTLWTAENGLICKFRQFKLRSFNILWGKSNPNENRWTTLIAYCGECGKNPLVLGESKICEHRSLICPEPDCGFCCDKCEKKNNAEGLENE